MGQPGWSRGQSSVARRRRTQGTETSQYLEEEKSIEMPQVAASERGSGLNRLSWRGGGGGGTNRLLVREREDPWKGGARAGGARGRRPRQKGRGGCWVKPPPGNRAG